MVLDDIRDSSGLLMRYVRVRCDDLRPIPFVDRFFYCFLGIHIRVAISSCLVLLGDFSICVENPM